MAFQGYGRGIDLHAVDELNELATGGLRPDLTILFDLNLEEARARLNQRDDEALALTGFDEEKRDFHVRVRDGYYQLAEKYPSRIHIIDAAGTVEEVHQRTLALTLKMLGSKND
jgi:dTMP kinase